MTLRAITLRRPWAGAVAHLGKRIENRSRPCPGLVGERIAIHAGQAWDENGWQSVQRISESADDRVWATGIVALATVVGWVDDRDELAVEWDGEMDDDELDAVLASPWWSGPCGWLLADVVALPAPVPCRGALGVWRLPPEVEAVVLAQIGKVSP